MTVRRSVLVFALLVAMTTVAGFLSAAAEQESVFVYGVPTGGTSVDPHMAADISENNWIASQAYEPLVRCWDRNGKQIIPLLAVSWESSED